MRSARLSLIVLAATLAPTIAGCGGLTATTAQPGNQTAAQGQRPGIPSFERAALEQAQAGVSASGHYTVDRARRRAGDALWRYQDLREEWLRAWSDDEKDRIEQRMLTALTGAATDIRRMTSDSWEYDEREINRIADRMLDEYQYLRQRWLDEWNLQRRREIVNDMLVELTGGLQQISDYYRRFRLARKQTRREP